MLTRKSLAIFSIFIFFLCTSHPKAFAYAEVNVSSVIYPPITSNQVIPGLGHGILIDIATEAFKAVAVKANYNLLPMARNVWSVVEEKNSICLGSMAWFKNQNKDGLVDYVEIININFMAFYMKSKFPDGVVFNTLSDLRKYNIGNVRGSGSQQTFDDAKLKIDLARDIRQNFLKLDAGRIDFAVALHVTGNYLIKELFPGRTSEFGHIEKPLLNTTLSLILLKKQSRIKQKFIEGLRLIAKNGTYYNILKKYYGEDQIPAGIIPESILRNMEKIRD